MARDRLYLTPGERGYVPPLTKLPDGSFTLTPPLRNPKGIFSQQSPNPDAGGVGGGAGGLTGQGGAGSALNIFGIHAGGSTNLDPLPGGPDVSFGFSSVTDFLNFVAWIFHPLNWLRLAEFIFGLVLMAMGINLLARRGGATRNPVTATARRIVSITPVGREIRTLQGRHMGRHEGQREAARMEARQSETYSQRRQSAYERERVKRDARRAARQSNP